MNFVVDQLHVYRSPVVDQIGNLIGEIVCRPFGRASGKPVHRRPEGLRPASDVILTCQPLNQDIFAPPSARSRLPASVGADDSLRETRALQSGSGIVRLISVAEIRREITIFSSISYSASLFSHPSLPPAGQLRAGVLRLYTNSPHSITRCSPPHPPKEPDSHATSSPSSAYRLLCPHSTLALHASPGSTESLHARRQTPDAIARSLLCTCLPTRPTRPGRFRVSFPPERCPDRLENLWTSSSFLFSGSLSCSHARPETP